MASVHLTLPGQAAPRALRASCKNWRAAPRPCRAGRRQQRVRRQEARAAVGGPLQRRQDAGSRDIYRARNAQQKGGDSFLFSASLATLVLGATLLAERLDGEGFIAKLDVDNAMHPVLVVSVLGLAAAAVWPHRPSPRQQDSISSLQLFAGRLSFAALAGTLLTEMLTGKGALSALGFIETGMQELTEVEAVLAFILLLTLTKPPRAA